MENKKIFKSKKLVLISIIICLVLCIFSFAWFVTLPSVEEDLVYSPFSTIGIWTCSELDFSIISTQNQQDDYFVKGFLIRDGKTQQIEFKYRETSFLNHKHAVVVEAYDMLSQKKIFECYYNFEPASFVFEDIKLFNSFKLGFSELNFVLEA